MQVLLFLVIPTALASIPTQCEIDCVSRFDPSCASLWDTQCAEEATDRCSQCPVCDSLYECPQANANYIYQASGGVTGLDGGFEVCNDTVNSDEVSVLEKVDGTPWTSQDQQLCFSQAAGNERCNRVHLFEKEGLVWCTCRTLGSCTQTVDNNAFSQIIQLKDGYARASKCQVLEKSPGYFPWLIKANTTCTTAISFPTNELANAKKCAIAAVAYDYEDGLIIYNPSTDECLLGELSCLSTRNQQAAIGSNIYALPKKATEYQFIETFTLEQKKDVCQRQCDLLQWCYSWALFDAQRSKSSFYDNCFFYGSKDNIAPVDEPGMPLVMGWNSAICRV